MVILPYFRTMSRSRKGAWIEIQAKGQEQLQKVRRSRKGAWIEIGKSLEYAKNELGRSRKGAWIEMIPPGPSIPGEVVAPVRERGLKYTDNVWKNNMQCRSRKGAWIEIAWHGVTSAASLSLP